MEIDVIELVIFLFCLIGCGINCWYIGRRNGIVGTIDMLTEQGYLDLEE